MTRRAGSLTAVLATAACLAGGVAPQASAHDSLAPPGAPHTWLPSEDWVMRHWVPFDERALTTRLGLRAHDLEAYLYNDHHALSDLVRARGLDPARLRDELVAPWRPRVGTVHFEVLRERTERMLTQPHLAQHVLFHVFHGGMLAHDPLGTFGLPAATVGQMRLDGLTPIEVAASGGIDAAALHADLLHHFRHDRDEGVRRRAAWPDRGAPHPRPSNRPARLLAAQPAPGRGSREPIRQGEVLARAARARVAPHAAPAGDERAPRRAPQAKAAARLLAATPRVELAGARSHGAVRVRPRRARAARTR